MQVKAIRSAIANLLSNYSWLHTYDKVTDVVKVPCAIVFPPDVIDYGVIFGGGTRLSIPIRLYVGRSQDPDLQDTLDAMISDDGPQSIKALLESDQRLNGLVQYTTVVMMRNYGPYPVGTLLYVGAEIVLDVMT